MDTRDSREGFKVQDSGNRQSFSTGSVRDTADDKPNFTLESIHARIRLAYHMMKGAVKYGLRNWELGQPVSRFLESAIRHLEYYRMGERTEDHLAAVLFNVGAIIHMEEEVILGHLPRELLDLPFYKDNADTAATATATFIPGIDLDATLYRWSGHGSGISYSLTLQYLKQLDISAVEFFEALGRLLHKRLIKAISANSKVFFVADILTDEEISRRIELVTGSKPSLIFGVPASSLANLIGSYAAKADVEIAVEWKDDNASGDSEDYCLDGSDEWSSSSWGDTGDWSDSDSSF